MLRMMARLLVACAVAHCAYGLPQIETGSPTLPILPPQNEPTPPPPYTSSARTTVSTINFIKQNIDYPLTSTKRNFIALNNGMFAMSKSVSSGLSYNLAYSTVQLTVLMSKLMPESSRYLLVTQFDSDLSKIGPVLKLIQDNCPNISSDQDCDQKIQNTIKTNPVYEASAMYLLEAGKLWELFSQQKTQALEAAAEDRVVEYLSDNKDTLKPLIEQGGLVLYLNRRL